MKEISVDLLYNLYAKPVWWLKAAVPVFCLLAFLAYPLSADEKKVAPLKEWVLAQPAVATSQPQNIQLDTWLPGISRGRLVLEEDGKVIPFLLLQRGKDDFVSLLFQSKDVAKLHVKLYADGETAGTEKWFPRQGLLLRTYRYPQGMGADNLAQMRAMLKKCKDDKLQCGASMVKNVFHGFNKFGDSESYVSEYRGRIFCPVDGGYTFATSSDDASFLLIDGKEVVSWPGGHGPVGDARHSAKVKLKKGWHDFAYLHVNFTGGACAVAAWKKPGEKKILPIPPEAFGKPAVVYHRLKPVIGGAPVIWPENLGETWINGRQLLRWGFSMSDGKAAVFNTGDGVESREKSVEQIYLQPGLRTIVARRGGEEYRLAVEIAPDYSRQVEKAIDRPKKYLRQIAKMPYEKLATPQLRVAVELLQENGAYPQGLAQAAGELLGRFEKENAPVKERVQTVVLLAKVLREKLKKAEDSAVLLRTELEGHLPDSLRAEVSRELGDTLFYYLDDLDGALNQYDMVVGRYGKTLQGTTARVTQIKIGDIYRQKKMSGKARAAYTKAQQMGQENVKPLEGKYRRGGLYRAVDDFLRRGKTENAREWVELLEWEFPLEKLDGYSSVLRAKIALKEKNPQEAIKQLVWYVGASPDSNYAMNAARLLSEIYRSQGQVGKAVEIEQKYGIKP